METYLDTEFIQNMQIVRTSKIQHKLQHFKYNYI